MVLDVVDEPAQALFSRQENWVESGISSVRVQFSTSVMLMLLLMWMSLTLEFTSPVHNDEHAVSGVGALLAWSQVARNSPVE